MFKVAVALILLVAVCHGQFGLPGGYSNKPELINTDFIQSLVVFAAEALSQSQNLFLTNLQVTAVQTQVVNGMNYKIGFTAQPTNPKFGTETKCEVVVYVPINGKPNLSSSQCQTS
ncbi:unnamed protein product [Rotaria magnacalcarata]|uniref:Cystatin domain-containing protein n=1 Tax=Rotaria magnacalcarata TaxID=392030 RepID=A0A816LRY3_9BILA|nr:unnamed protein product [Rotaria magnacalcarata]CAF1546923.1 unnamed protein product [Rotaria magnacalcarata]CAF1956502.1 unnamed protein product [Rotaria magnacalcarata]CAF1991992.1 unnamed protein product [Rotaria magnacalcarata]CAF2041085.1 unnamed protein product [Rotaria magnacalcarata]